MNEDLLAPLRDADVRPPRVDLQQAMRTGRRRQKARYTAAAVTALAAAVVATVAIGTFTGRPQTMPVDRTPVPLPTSTIAPPLGECTLSMDTAPYADRYPWVVLDDTWQVAVHLDAPGTAPVEAVRYTGGRVEHIPGVPSGFQVTHANRAGDFAGVSVKNERGWVYRDGRFTRLKLPDGATGIALDGMNEAGDLVGTVIPRDASQRAAVVWPGGHPDRPRALDTPAGQSSRAYGIAWDGSVVGEVFEGDTVTPFLWHPDGIGVPLSGGGAGVTGLTGDWAVGPHVRWNIRTGQTDVIKGLDGSGAVDVYGRVFGNSDTADHHQVVWINGAVQPVPQRFDGWNVQFQAVRGDGRQMYGLSTSGKGWVRWDC